MSDPGYRWAIEIRIEQPIVDADKVRQHLEQHLGRILDRVCYYHEEQMLTIVLDHKHFFMIQAERAEIEKTIRRLSRGKPRFKLLEVRACRWTGYSA